MNDAIIKEEIAIDYTVIMLMGFTEMISDPEKFLRLKKKFKEKLGK